MVDHFSCIPENAEEQNDTLNIIRTARDYQYCPTCGSGTEVREERISENRVNIEIICPEHGTLVHA